MDDDRARLLHEQVPSTLKLRPFLDCKDGEARWHSTRAHDYQAWIIPSALLMTAGLSLVMVLETRDVAAPTDLLLDWLTGGSYAGSSTEVSLREAASHLYLFAMVTSGMHHSLFQA